LGTKPRRVTKEKKRKKKKKPSAKYNVLHEDRLRTPYTQKIIVHRTT